MVLVVREFLRIHRLELILEPLVLVVAIVVDVVIERSERGNVTTEKQPSTAVVLEGVHPHEENSHSSIGGEVSNRRSYPDHGVQR